MPYDLPRHVSDAYPEGTVEIPARPAPTDQWSGSSWVNVPPAPDFLPLTARQLRLGLIDNGISPSDVQAALEALPAGAQREKALVEWEYAATFDRLHPLIATVGAALDLTDKQIDTMWTAAAAL